MAYQDEAIGANALLPMAHRLNKRSICWIKQCGAVVNEDKVIAAAAIFREENLFIFLVHIQQMR